MKKHSVHYPLCLWKNYKRNKPRRGLYWICSRFTFEKTDGSHRRWQQKLEGPSTLTVAPASSNETDWPRSFDVDSWVVPVASIGRQRIGVDLSLSGRFGIRASTGQLCWILLKTGGTRSIRTSNIWGNADICVLQRRYSVRMNSELLENTKPNIRWYV